MANDPPIISYPNGFFASNTDPGQGAHIMNFPITDPPGLLSFVPPVPNAVGGNLARSSGFDTLSSGSNQADTSSALIGVLSSPGKGQHWGCQKVGTPGLSAYGLLWRVPGKTLENNIGNYATRSAAGVTNGTTRVIILSTPNRAGNHAGHRNTTIITSISAAIDLAVLYRNGSSATYTISADASMKNSSGHSTAAFYNSLAAGVSATGDEYNVDTNVGPNIRRLVQLGYR
tara:strand:+ start:74 stop:763 length:690 start_codon:yes stop_codon:yes gene_type:complete